MNESEADAELKAALKSIEMLHKRDPYAVIARNREIARNSWKIDAGWFSDDDEGESPADRRERVLRKLINTTREDSAFALLNTITIVKLIADIQESAKRQKVLKFYYTAAALVIGIVFGRISIGPF